MYNYSTTSYEIKEKLDIADIIGDHIELNKRGRDFWGLCPFHVERTPSFSVSPEKQVFHCFGCGESGDVISFIMKFHNVDFKTACNILAGKAGLLVRELSQEDQQRLRAQKLRKEKEKLIITKLQSKIDSEYSRLVHIERWCNMFLRNIRDQRDLDRPAVIWALRTKDIAAFCLDMLLKPGIAEKLAALKLSRGVESWTKNYEA